MNLGKIILKMLLITQRGINMRIYTRSGDKGTTSLVHGKRVAKDDIRVEAYGTVDELNSIIGTAASLLQGELWDGKESVMNTLHTIQTILFHVGSELATPEEREVAWKLKQKHIDDLETSIDTWDKNLPILDNFILPSGHPVSAQLHFARTVARRAERRIITMEQETGNVNPLVISYVNRLSDLLFVAARFVNHGLGGQETHLRADV